MKYFAVFLLAILPLACSNSASSENSETLGLLSSNDETALFYDADYEVTNSNQKAFGDTDQKLIKESYLGDRLTSSVIFLCLS